MQRSNIESMGYRHYFYLVEKTQVEAVKRMSISELYEYAEKCGSEVSEEDGKKYFYFNDEKFMNKTEIFEFGKLYFDDTAERIYSKGIPLFEKQEVQEYLSDYAPYVVGKDGLLEAIKIYEEKVLKYYKSLLSDDEEPQQSKMLECVEDKIRTLSAFGLADIDKTNKMKVTSSWEYEHSIFNLVHILKTIDWEKDTILFYGW